jgi:hypothetical protein
MQHTFLKPSEVLHLITTYPPPVLCATVNLLKQSHYAGKKRVKIAHLDSDVGAKTTGRELEDGHLDAHVLHK